MSHALKKLVKEGDAHGVRAHLDSEATTTNDLLWCAYWATDEACRELLIDAATTKKITPKKKGYPWNDAHAAAIVGDPAGIAKAEKRKADFEAVVSFGTPLTIAARLDHADFVRALLEKGVDATKPVRIARVKGVTIFSGSMFMTDATPLGAALRLGNEASVDAFLERIELEPEHLLDAVQGGDEKLIRRVLDALGDRAPLTPAVFWRVHDPAVLPVLAERGLDVKTLPTDTGTWGGPIWSWWAYNLWGGGEERVDRFVALFATGVPATSSGLGDVLGANIQGIASTEMVDAFIAGGADLTEEIEWEGDDWDEENDCQKVERGSLAARMMREGELELVKYIHAKGAPLQPMRANPDWYEADEKKAWLEELGMVKSLDASAFPWLDSPSADEIRSFFAHEKGIYGLSLGMTRDEIPDDFDIERAEDGDGLSVYFDDDGKLESVSRQYYDVSAEVFFEALTAKLGKPRGSSAKRWRVPGGIVKLREDWNDAGLFTYVSMQVTKR